MESLGEINSLFVCAEVAFLLFGARVHDQPLGSQQCVKHMRNVLCKLCVWLLLHDNAGSVLTKKRKEKKDQSWAGAGEHGGSRFLGPDTTAKARAGSLTGEDHGKQKGRDRNNTQARQLLGHTIRTEHPQTSELLWTTTYSVYFMVNSLYVYVLTFLKSPKCYHIHSYTYTPSPTNGTHTLVPTFNHKQQCWLQHLAQGHFNTWVHREGTKLIRSRPLYPCTVDTHNRFKMKNMDRFKWW